MWKPMTIREFINWQIQAMQPGDYIVRELKNNRYVFILSEKARAKVLDLYFQYRKN